MVEDTTRSHRSLHVPIVEVGEATVDEFRWLVKDLASMKMQDRFVETLAASSGYCAGYFVEKSAVIRILSAKLLS